MPNAEHRVKNDSKKKVSPPPSSAVEFSTNVTKCLSKAKHYLPCNQIALKTMLFDYSASV